MAAFANSNVLAQALSTLDDLREEKDGLLIQRRCMRCGKFYNMMDNLEFGCRFHPGQAVTSYDGSALEIYDCCGARKESWTDREPVGCLKCCHSDNPSDDPANGVMPILESELNAMFDASRRSSLRQPVACMTGVTNEKMVIRLPTIFDPKNTITLGQSKCVWCKQVLSMLKRDANEGSHVFDVATSWAEDDEHTRMIASTYGVGVVTNTDTRRLYSCAESEYPSTIMTRNTHMLVAKYGRDGRLRKFREHLESTGRNPQLLELLDRIMPS